MAYCNINCSYIDTAKRLAIENEQLKKQLAEAKVKADKYDELVDTYILKATRVVIRAMLK